MSRVTVGMAGMLDPEAAAGCYSPSHLQAAGSSGLKDEAKNYKS